MCSPWAGESVAIMQEISEGRLSIPTMPAETQIRRGKPMPLWMFCLLEEAHKGGKFWWHVCVDNFAAGQVDKPEGNFTGGEMVHQLAEEAWSAAGVVSPPKKRKAKELTAQELGAHFAKNWGHILVALPGRWGPLQSGLSNWYRPQSGC